MNILTRMHLSTSLFAVLLIATTSPRLCADNYTIETTGLATVTGELVFDFTSGGGPSSNTLTLSSFATDGTLGASSVTGLVTGTLPATVTLSDDPNTSAFNEYATTFTFGDSISFVLSSTSNGPGPSSSPDEFAVFLLASDGFTSLIATSDPTGADSLLAFDIDGSSTGDLTIFDVSTPAGVSATVTEPITSTPEPSSFFLLGGLCVALALYRSRRLYRSQLPR